MKQRIIVAVIGIPLLLAILCVAPDWATAALLAALSVVGTHELLAAVCGPEKTRRWTALPLPNLMAKERIKSIKSSEM